MRGRWILCLASAVLGGWIAASVSSGAGGAYGYQHLATDCVVTETASGSMVAARTDWRMWNHRHSANDLDGYRWQARLIPTSPGFNLHRSWEGVELDRLEADGDGSYHAAVTTPLVSSNLDWDLQVKLTWDRSDRRDWTVERVLDFNEASCST